MSLTHSQLLKSIEFFESKGIDVPQEILDEVARAQHIELESGAVDYFTNVKSLDPKDAVHWQECAFTWAELVAGEFEASEANRGKGKVMWSGFTVETPHGKLKVELTNVIED